MIVVVFSNPNDSMMVGRRRMLTEVKSIFRFIDVFHCELYAFTVGHLNSC